MTPPNFFTEKLPNFRLSFTKDGDVKKIAMSLFEWIRESQKNVDRNRIKQQRPPWLGSTERQRSYVAPGTTQTETASAKPNAPPKVSRKDAKLGYLLDPIQV